MKRKVLAAAAALSLMGAQAALAQNHDHGDRGDRGGRDGGARMQGGAAANTLRFISDSLSALRRTD